ncbi:MAG: tetratricopeptide repeat protein [Myxococcota bacterium]
MVRSVAPCLLAVVVVLATAAGVLAQPGDPPEGEDDLTARLDAAEEAFRYQDYERTIRLLQPLVAEGRLDDSPLEAQVLEWLGASYWFTGAMDAARLTFSSLLKEDPDHEMDPLFYPRELITFFDREKRRLEKLGFIGPGRAEPREGGPRLTLVRTVTERQAPTVAYLMPFGVGQFANDQFPKGTLVAVLQGVGLALNIGAWVGVESLKIGGTDRVPPGDEGQARLLRAMWWAGSAVFLGSWGYSIADGFANRPPRREVRREFEVLDRDELPGGEETGVRLRFGPSARGLGLGVSGEF